MTTTTQSTALATIQPPFTEAERLALAGFLAGYRGLTREACTLDLRQFASGPFDNSAHGTGFSPGVIPDFRAHRVSVLAKRGHRWSDHGRLVVHS